MHAQTKYTQTRQWKKKIEATKHIQLFTVEIVFMIDFTIKFK